MDMKKQRKPQDISGKKRCAMDFLVTASILLLAFSSSMLLVHYTNSTVNVTAIFTLAVLLTSRMTDGYVWGIAASVIGVFIINYAFAEPYFGFSFTMTGYPIIFTSLTLTSILTSAMTGSVKRQAQRARVSEQHMHRLYEFSQQLANVRDENEMIRLTMQYLHEQLNCPVIYLENEDDVREDRERVVGEIDGFISDSVEHSAISDCFRELCDTGAGTTHSPFSAFHYMPISGGNGMLGCIGILWRANIAKDESLDHIHAILAQTGISLERQRLAEERNRAAIAADREKLRSNLLRTISHDLRTPLTSMIGASTVIEENGERISAGEIRKLAADIHGDAEWLLRMVENLLSVTRVSQVAELKKSEEAAEEVITEAVTRCKKRFPDAQIRVNFPKEMLFIPMDAMLIVQVLINLMENAVRYAGTPIDITLRRDGAFAEFSVRDFGPGIPADKQETLFHAVEMQPDNRRGGLGIGLTLCRSIILAHGGSIREINHPDGGAQFLFTLPLEEEL